MQDLSPILVRSFATNRGKRGVHFYDDAQCEFVGWSEVMDRSKDIFPENFYDKLIEAIANYDPESEFVTVTAGNGQITIELFKSQEM